MTSQAQSLPLYRLGETDIALPKITLGAANFGGKWGPRWTLDAKNAEALFDRALDAGICAFDTANVYNRGESERWLGQLIRLRKSRQRLTISSKFGYRYHPSESERMGSGRVAMHLAAEDSLRRLGTDYIDIYYLHLWDAVTPIEETLEAAHELVKKGWIRTFALSNVPNWYLARADLQWRNISGHGIAAIQLNYNLINRHIEADYDHLVRITRTPIIAWGGLANGLLSGKYTIDRKRRQIHGSGRVSDATFTSGTIDPYQMRVVSIIKRVENVARNYGIGSAELALSWLFNRRNVASSVIGVTSRDQLELAIRSALFSCSDVMLSDLDAVTNPDIRYPNDFLSREMLQLVSG